MNTGYVHQPGGVRPQAVMIAHFFLASTCKVPLVLSPLVSGKSNRTAGANGGEKIYRSFMRGSATTAAEGAKRGSAYASTAAKLATSGTAYGTVVGKLSYYLHNLQ